MEKKKITKQVKVSKPIAPEFYEAITESFLEYCDREGKIPYSKVKFVLRYKFRVPNERLGSIVKEFCKFGLLIRHSQRELEVTPTYIVKFKNLN